VNKNEDLKQGGKAVPSEAAAGESITGTKAWAQKWLNSLQKGPFSTTPADTAPLTPASSPSAPALIVGLNFSESFLHGIWDISVGPQPRWELVLSIDHYFYYSEVDQSSLSWGKWQLQPNQGAFRNLSLITEGHFSKTYYRPRPIPSESFSMLSMREDIIDFGASTSMKRRTADEPVIRARIAELLAIVNDPVAIRAASLQHALYRVIAETNRQADILATQRNAPLPIGAPNRSCVPSIRHYEQAIAQLEKLRPEAQWLSTQGYAKLLELLQTHVEDWLKVINLFRQMDADDAAAVGLAWNIGVDTSKKLVASTLKVNQGWADVFAQSNRAFSAYLKQ
jgi:hypothetical protein